MSLPAGWSGADILFLDCDSTLAAVEGIDELARRKGVDVAALTAQAMDGEIPLQQVYRRRLELIDPSAEDLAWAAQRYSQAVVPGAAAVVNVLQQLGVACHLLSGGLLPALQPFARALGFADDAIYGVPYPLSPTTSSRDALEIACAHPLARSGGKPELIEALCADLGIPRARRMLVGDGVSDLEAAAAVGLFAGFGGVSTRAAVVSGADVFLPGPGLHAVAALAAGERRNDALRRQFPDLWQHAQAGVQRAQALVQEGQVPGQQAQDPVQKTTKPDPSRP